MFGKPLGLYQRELENKNIEEFYKTAKAVLESYKWKPTYQFVEVEEIEEEDDDDKFYEGCYESVLNKSWSEIVYPDATPLIKFI